MSSPALTPDEIAEVMAYARQHPELAKILASAAGPRTVLNLIRQKKEETK